MRYSSLGGGKRLRQFLVARARPRVGGPREADIAGGAQRFLNASTALA